MEKERLDILLSKQEKISRTQASEFICAGRVVANDVKIIKPSTKLPSDTKLNLTLPSEFYVSRGGYKLGKALKYFEIDVSNKICADIGASTGGFTDCLLQNNAAFVYAIDSGHGQLVDKLLNHPKVKSLEGVNAKDLSPTLIGDLVDFISIDVSFISLEKILLPVTALMRPNADLVCLIKPQFEVGIGKVNKQGIVKNPKEHIRIINNIITYSQSINLFLNGITFSPITGSDGNVEYLAYFKLTAKNFAYDIKTIVMEALEGAV